MAITTTPIEGFNGSIFNNTTTTLTAGNFETNDYDLLEIFCVGERNPQYFSKARIVGATGTNRLEAGLIGTGKVLIFQRQTATTFQVYEASIANSSPEGEQNSWIISFIKFGGEGDANVQADWNETDTNSDAFIQNKPTIPSGSGSGFNLRGAWVSGEAIAANDIVYVGDGNSRVYWLAIAPIIGTFNTQTPAETSTFWTRLTGIGGSGLSVVVSDTSIGGDGTTGSPLRVQNPFTATQETKLTGIEEGATVGATQAQQDAIVIIQTKLNTIEDDATADQTAAEIRDSLATLTGNDRLSAANIRDIPNPNEVEYFSMATGTDLNSLVPPSGTNATRRYAITDPTNAPSGVNGSIVVDGMRIGTDLRQVLYDTNAIYIRGARNNFTGNTTWTNLANTGSGGGLVSVSTDATITGDGTADDPLSVANPFTDADETKLDNIETGATADQTAPELVTALQTLTGASRLDASAIKNLPTAEAQSALSFATPESSWANNIDNFVLLTDGVAYFNLTNPTATNLPTGFDGAVLVKVSKQGQDTIQTISSAVNGVAKVYARTGRGTPLTAVFGDLSSSGGITTEQAQNIAANTQKRSYPQADETKLGTIEDSATADQTPEEIKDALETFTGDERLDASAIKNIPQGGAGSPDTGEQIVDKLEALPDAQKLPPTAIQGVGNPALLAAAGGTDIFQYLDHTTPFVVPANLTSGTVPIDGDGLVIPLIIKRNSVEPVLGGPRNPFFSYYEGFLEMTKSLTAFFRFDLEFTHYINEVVPSVPSPQVDIRTFQQAFSFNGPFSVPLNIFNARSFVPAMPSTAGIIPISAQLRIRAFNPFNNAARIAVPYTNLQFLSADATYLQFRPVRTPAIPNLAADLYAQVNNPATFEAIIRKIDETMFKLVSNQNQRVEIDNSEYTINDMAKLGAMRTMYSKLLVQAEARAGNRKYSKMKLRG